MSDPIPYTAITQAIASQLETRLTGQSPRPRVTWEAGLEAPDESLVNVKLVSRVAIPNQQALTAGRLLRMRLRFEVSCWRFGMTVLEGMRLRDSLIGDIELALMADRTMGSTVTRSWLEGGTMNKPPEPRALGFLIGGTTMLAADAQAQV